MNIRFEYLYRDAGNFKKWGDVVFSNPRGITPEAATKMAEEALIDSNYFAATKAGVPDLHFPDYNEQLDHGLHEMHGFFPTNETPTDREDRTVEEFVRSFRAASVA